MAPAYVDVVFEGGGAKGVVFLGALEVLEGQGYQPRRLVGTSACAITAALLAAGYRSAQLAEVGREKTADGRSRFSTFLDPPAGFPQPEVEASELVDAFRQVSILDALARHHVPVPGIATGLDNRLRLEVVQQLLRLTPFRTLFSFVERGGLYEGAQFLGWIREKVEAAGPGWGDSTLGGFQQATGRDLTVVASDTSGNEMLVLNHRTAPGCPVAWAVRMSMSIRHHRVRHDGRPHGGPRGRRAGRHGRLPRASGLTNAHPDNRSPDRA
jgi:predicted acylesterase/phospholipase RssA